MQTRIGILGLGGVGGYFGGLLAKEFVDSETVEIVFITRGLTQKQVLENGLKIIMDESEMTVFPSKASDNPEVIGKLDYLICATKTYDLEASLNSIKACITKNTVILPLYNGVDAPERISALFPENDVLQGCVYILSKIETPAVIRKVGHFEKLYFGSPSSSMTKMKALQAIFLKANIQSSLVDTIEDAVWEKYVFISALAAVTTYLNQNVGEVMDNIESRELYVALLHEITLLAAVKGINLPDDIIMQTILKLEKCPKETTSSMHRDALAGNNFELDSLVSYVVNEGVKYEVETPSFQKVFDKLSLLTPEKVV
ncbi:ketopantoate reductase family protein [Flavobacterium algicola]|uniref:ketopantoate reductase family protein n=1 Tax=Flavobacterium algicola TaxID=556529 RepID=UPI001EFE21D1|nr:2-dehydropantoate 2-reductase [Flavobacterium algicola]MCG9793636.1 2-dehydropantoate 2-reductase [Flavobacterium algicola]